MGKFYDKRTRLRESESKTHSYDGDQLAAVFLRFFCMYHNFVGSSPELVEESRHDDVLLTDLDRSTWACETEP